MSQENYGGEKKEVICLKKNYNIQNYCIQKDETVLGKGKDISKIKWSPKPDLSIWELAICIKGSWLIKLIELTKSLHSFLKIILTVIATKKTLIANTCVCMLSCVCLTLCDPMDCSLPGSSVHWTFQARILSGLPFPCLGDLPDPGIEPCLLSLLHWQDDSLLLPLYHAPGSSDW